MVVINAITTPGRTSDGDDGDVVWDPWSDQLEKNSESERGISMRLPMIVDMNTSPDVIKDVAMVRDQPETQPNDCMGELIPEPIIEMVPDLM